jgi:hypothetical protein
MQTCRTCGCTQEKACPEGCFWIEPDLCSTCAVAALGPQGLADFLTVDAIEAPRLTWLAVHGNLKLALQHPANQEGHQTTGLVRQFVAELEECLLQVGALTPEMLAMIREDEDAPRIILP